ncbi:STAS domain-containing protein [Candidatus Aquicultor sp.]
MQEKRLNDLSVRRVMVNNVNMIIADGECDICSVQLLKDEIAEAINEGNKKLIVDVKKVQYLDNSGLAVILWARHKIEENDGRLVVVGLNGKFRRKLNSFGNLLSIVSSVREALGILGKSGLSYKQTSNF